MINIASVGPPQIGAPDLKSAKSESGDDQLNLNSNFAKTLNDKISSKPDVKEKKSFKINGDDPPREKADSEIKDKPPSMGITTKKTQLAREKEIQKFMDSFESEFGIPPTRLVEAMAQLNITDQQKSPEDTADQLISSLKMDQDDQLRAKEMYLGFLVNLQTIEQTPRAPLAVPVNPENLMKTQMNERFLAHQGKGEILRNSLATMNDKFWMKAPAVPVSAPLAAETEIIPAQQALTIGDLLREQENLSGPQPGAPIASTMQMDAKSSPEELQALAQKIDPEVLEKMSPADLQKLVKELRMAKDQDARNSVLGLNPETKMAAAVVMQSQVPSSEKEKTTREGAVAVSASTVTGEKGEIAKPLRMESNLTGPAVKTPPEFFPSNPSMNSGQDSFAQGKGKDQLSELSSKKKSEISSDEVIYGSTAGLNTMTPLKQEVPSLHGQAPAPVVSPQEKQENVQQLMNQAQYLIKKGGGEMKIKMSPEGLGDMHLKVMVENGKVNVQMSTETTEAKKMVESSLSDLKHSLSAHRLSVENVKVDVVNSTSTDVATRQDSNNLNSQGQFQGHKDTQKFWNQFQEQFGSRAQRESFFDVPGIKGYGQKKSDPLTPLTEAQRSRRADGRGSAIDVVA